MEPVFYMDLCPVSLQPKQPLCPSLFLVCFPSSSSFSLVSSVQCIKQHVLICYSNAHQNYRSGVVFLFACLLLVFIFLLFLFVCFPFSYLMIEIMLAQNMLSQCIVELILHTNAISLQKIWTY